MIINLYGGPGTGKSTIAAAVFAELKFRGHTAELVTEYAKDKVWELSYNTLANQIYVFGKQQFRVWRVYKQVEFVVTDSPLLLSLYYGRHMSVNFHDLVLDEFYKYRSIEILLERVKPYVQSGRYQTELEAREIDKEIEKILEDTVESWINFPGTMDSVLKIADLAEGMLPLW